MRIHTLIHAPFEKLGCIEQWIEQKGHQVSETHTYLGNAVPDVTTFDFLIVMGGPQSATRMDSYPYLAQEVTLVQQTIAKNKPILGICLGAQIIAEALGGKTERSPYQEVGMYPVHVSEAGKQDPLFKQFPVNFDAMHWHSDMPGVTKECVLLAESKGCPRQAFRYGDRVYGFQFHLEMTRDLLHAMLANCGDDLKAGTYIRGYDEILASDCDEMNQLLFFALNHLASYASP